MTVLARCVSTHYDGPVVVLSGDNESPPETPSRLLAAQRITDMPLRVIGANTKEEIALAIAMSQDNLTLVTSAYHVPRAFLTAVACLHAIGRERQLRVWMVAAKTEGTKTEQREKRMREMVKIRRYRHTGDVASEADALAYIAWRDGD